MTDALATQRKRLRFRSWHRGLKELDLLMGSFADAHLGSFDAAQLTQFEKLLELPEPVLYAWLVGRAAPPAGLQNEVLELLLDYDYKPPAR
ncbi:MAG TPA: succinate dehydrogenase assembly factor 2 [Kiloniellaceae bacterium]|nr:succinate dehydrogenase assembly factor 2 [Kiloniellaceae bacterium]